MTPEQIAASGTESAHQKALFAWAALNQSAHPELKWLFHIPNGGSRGDTARSRMIQGAKLKAEGVRPGVADLMLPVRRGDLGGLFIEMKRPSERPVRATSRGGVSDEQREFALFVEDQGYRWQVCYSWDEAAREITDYLRNKF